MPPTILSYLDYRHYLTDLFSALQSEDPEVSYRSFARMAGSSSPNWLQLIRDRKLNIQPEGIGALARAMKLSSRELSYFETIVAFDHAKTHDEKDRFFQRILSTRDYGPVKQLDKDQYEYFSHWYVPVVRELLTSPRYNGDPAWIAGRIIPEVSEAKVRKAVRLLETLGMIRRNDAGAWVQSEAAISTPSEVISLAVTRYHRDVIALADQSIERFAPQERDIRSVTLGVSKEGVEVVKQRLEAFWKELLAYAGTQNAPETVVQVNLQMFPLTKTIEEGHAS